MAPSFTLGYGRTPLEIHLRGQDPPPQHVRIKEEITHTAQVLPRAAGVACAQALASPIGAARLRGRVRPGSNVVIIVSDATRDEPREALVRAVLDEIAVPIELTIAVANGTHTPGPIDALGLSADLLSRARVYNHEPTAGSHFVDVGTTARGTRVRLPRLLLAADLVVATGRIRPHYFAGYGAGAKAIFPGLGCREDIRQNHLLKRHPTSRLGRVENNACRDDIEDATRLLPVETHLLDVATPHAPVTAVAGDLLQAFRAGVALCRPLHETHASPADVVITSDALPLSASLYQASKLLAPAGMLLRPGGTAILVAECPEGTGPLEIVNEGIYRLGIRHFFPEAHTIYLVSSLPESIVARTYCRYAPSVEAVLATTRGQVAVLPYAGNVIPIVT